jgi:hydrogenase maturation factor
MCFAVPYRVKKTDGRTATLDDGRTIVLGPELTVKPGMYVEVAGGIAVSVIEKSVGDDIRKRIKDLSSL